MNMIFTFLMYDVEEILNFLQVTVKVRIQLKCKLTS